MNSTLVNSVTKFGSKLAVKAAKHAPEILVGAGITSMGVAVIHACKLTLKADHILDNYNERMAKIDEAVEKSSNVNDPFAEKYTEKDARKDTTVAYLLTAKDFVKHYWAPMAEFTIGVVCICVAHRILNKRVLYLAASYNGLQKTYNTYRSRIKDEYGEEADIFGVTGAHKQNHEYTEVQEDGTQVEKTEEVRPVNVGDLSDCAVIFDEMYSTEWTDNPLANLSLIRKIEAYYNDILGYKRDFVMWSDCLIDLGIWNRLPVEKKKMILGKGWVYDPNNPRKINFGIIDINRPITDAAKDMIMGYEASVCLDPNIDGDVATLL